MKCLQAMIGIKIINKEIERMVLWKNIYAIKNYSFFFVKI